ncbi:DUF3237 domain-containing protein [Sphingomonas sp.]|uniref:DUF3237 domain-containing protein n=1 Tax=Sphingomonas sp. TaxID=28214 RepID=UPI000DB01C16|nr:DUF3237 domain-containing protein [Sphingomonas sp.]PZU10951.1 MAG: DUF3237 domain-containing protein [Sphingomonas sp.]
MTDVAHPFLPKLEHAFSIEIRLQPSMRVEPNPIGASRVAVYIEEGIIDGPLLRGRVLPMTGGDWALLRPDGTIDFDARYMLELEDGSIVYMQNRGYRWASEEAMAKQARREDVPFEDYYMRVSPKFEVRTGPHDWLTRHVFVGVGEKIPTGNRIHYFVVR